MLRGLLIGLTLCLLMSLMVLGGVVWWFEETLDRPGPSEAETVLVIERGAGVRDIAALLHDAGVVRHPWLFIAASRRLDAGRALRAGEYAFAAGISLRGVVAQVMEGRTLLHFLTIPEGLTSTEIVTLLRAEERLAGALATVPEEGSLLPETYGFKRGDSRAAMIARMQAAQAAVLAELWPNRSEGLPLANQREAIILASIVEKETGVAGERAKVAGVFLNRLRRGMRLQADPTVVYALTRGQTPLGRALTRADWQVDDPYNTYQNAGLPPGPIANPGRAAIAAVLQPAQHRYLYFVADGSGGHAFARSLAEHNRNVAAWRRFQRQQQTSP